MGIVLYECGNDNGIAAAKMTCLSARIWFSIDLLLLIVILYQITLRVRRTHKKFSRKLLILYLLLIQPLSILPLPLPPPNPLTFFYSQWHI